MEWYSTLVNVSQPLYHKHKKPADNQWAALVDFILSLFLLMANFHQIGLIVTLIPAKALNHNKVCFLVLIYFKVILNLKYTCEDFTKNNAIEVNFSDTNNCSFLAKIWPKWLNSVFSVQKCLMAHAWCAEQICRFNLYFCTRWCWIGKQF